MNKILVIGAGGQVGRSLVSALEKQYGQECIVAADKRRHGHEVQYEPLDVLDVPALDALLEKHTITQVYHLAALLSARNEKHPQEGWHLNTQGLVNVLEAVRGRPYIRVFWPSSIAVFGPSASRYATQYTYQDPTTMYGISKLAGEHLCAYYRKKYDLDVRSLRYPGLVGDESPGGGATDYAVHMYRACKTGMPYVCYLSSDTRLPMMYMEDAIRGTTELMRASFTNLSVFTSYNFASMSFSPAELSESIRQHYPSFEVRYDPDFRDRIAKSWPAQVDDKSARKDWKWCPAYNLERLSEAMLHLSEARAE